MIKITSNFNSTKLFNDLKKHVLNTEKMACPACKRKLIPMRTKGEISCPSCKAKILIK